jgi:hypothetical protein
MWREIRIGLHHPEWAAFKFPNVWEFAVLCSVSKVLYIINGAAVDSPDADGVYP